MESRGTVNQGLKQRIEWLKWMKTKSKEGDQEIEKGRAEEVEMKIKRDSKRVRQRYNGEQNQGGWE